MVTLARFLAAYVRWRRLALPIADASRMAWFSATHPRTRFP